MVDPMEDVVILLDELGRSAGTAPKSSVHHADTPLHLGFSCYLFHRSTDQVLMSRRALTKRTWPGVWSNACCGHPRPSEDLPEAAARRIREELGLTASGLRIVLPEFSYRAVDAHGVVENELCPVLVGTVEHDPRPNPAEVSGWSWTSWDDLCLVAVRASWTMSPWAAQQIPQLASAAPGLPPIE